MKREELKTLELSDEAIEAVMKLHGKDIEDNKAKLTEADQTVKDLQKQVEDAGKTIEGFKKLDPEGIQKQADDWKAQAEKAQADAEQAIQKLKFDHALSGALAQAKAKNPKAVKALLDTEALKLNEADGSVIGLKEQLEKVQSENDYLFDSDKPVPTIVAGASGKNVNLDSVAAAARKAAGLPTE